MSGSSSGERVGTILIFSGLAMGIIGLVLTIALGAIWPLLIIVVGFSDMIVGMLFRSGRLGTSVDATTRPGEEFSKDEDFGVSSSENPYARED